MTFRTVFAALAVALVLPLAGCDETSQSLELADEAIVIADAQIARQNGDYQQATALLQGALNRNPTSAPVRTELATTVLASRNLNLLDLDRIAQFLVDGTGGITRGRAQGDLARGAACPYATDGTSRQFDPTTDTPDYPAVKASRGAIDSVLTLVEPILPASLKTFDINTSVGADGQLTYNQAASAQALRDYRGSDGKALTEVQIGQLLAANALARFFDAYLVVTDIAQKPTWYRLTGNRIGVCADDLNALQTQSRPSIEKLGTAVLSLDVRTKSFGGSAELVQIALDAFKDIRAAFQNPPQG